MSRSKGSQAIEGIGGGRFGSAHRDGTGLCVRVSKSSVKMSTWLSLARAWWVLTRELWAASRSHLNRMDMNRDSLEFYSLWVLIAAAMLPTWRVAGRLAWKQRRRA